MPSSAPPAETLASNSPPEKETAAVALRGYPQRDSRESLFEHVAWFYAFCREYLFRDATSRIITALWPDEIPTSGERLMELGCGPGFYSCSLAARFRELHVIGIDRCARQLDWAKARARKLGHDRCRFERANALDVPCENDSFDAVIASRLFTILPERERVLSEVFRVLRPGGRCFMAEPCSAFRTAVPLTIMRLLARPGNTGGNGFCEPRRATVLRADVFEGLFATQPWKSLRCWRDGRYQYALCEKG